MDDLRAADLWIHVQREASHVAIIWAGTSEAREPALYLLPYLDDLVNELHGSVVEIDFSAMDFMNSATIAPIVRFLRSLDRHCTKVRVLYDPSRTFQRTTFSAIKALGIVLRKLEVVAKGEGQATGSASD